MGSSQPVISALADTAIMIDVNRDKLLTFRELSAKIPPRRNNRPAAISTIHRWRSRGIRGTRLEAIRVGGAWLTSEQAFSRFCERLTLGNDFRLTNTAISDRQSTQRPEVDRKLDVLLGKS